MCGFLEKKMRIVISYIIIERIANITMKKIYLKKNMR
jgi:hypothetical protein